MAQQVITLGTANVQVANQVSWRFTDPDRPTIIPALVAGGANALFADLALFRTGTHLNFKTSSFQGTSENLVGPQMGDDWLATLDAIIINAGPLRLSLPGPNYPDNEQIDFIEPYAWSPPFIVEAQVEAFLDAYPNLSDADKAATTMTLRDEPIPRSDDINILVTVDLDSGPKRYSRTPVIGANFYDSRLVGFDLIEREVSVLPRDIRIGEIVLEIDNTDQALSRLQAMEEFLHRNVTIRMGTVGNGENNYVVIAKARIFKVGFRRDVFFIRAADEMFFSLDEPLVGGRFNNQMAPLVVGDPGGRIPARVISNTAGKWAIAQGSIPDPTAIFSDGIRAMADYTRETIDGHPVTTAQVTSSRLLVLRNSSPAEVWEINPDGANDEGQEVFTFDANIGSDAGSTVHDGRILIAANQGGGLAELYELNLEANSARLLRQLPTGLAPAGLVSHDSRLLVSESGPAGWIWEIDPDGADDEGTQLRRAPTGVDPRALASYEGRLLIASIIAPKNIWEIDPDGDDTEGTNLRSLPSGISTPSGMAYVNGRLLIIDIAGTDLWHIDPDGADDEGTMLRTLPTAATAPIALTRTITRTVEWEGSGITDDGTENGNVITNPVLQIKALLQHQGFAIDTVSTTLSAAVASDKSLGGALVFTETEETLRDALARIAESYNASAYLAGDGAGVAIPPIGVTPSTVVELDETNILEGGLDLATVEEVGSTLEYAYNLQLTDGEFQGQGSEENATAATDLGRTITHSVEMPFIRAATVAETIAEDRLSLLSPDRLVGTIAVKPSLAMDIDIGTVVQVTHFEGPGPTGLNAVNFFVTGVRLESDEDIVLVLTVVDLT